MLSDETKSLIYLNLMQNVGVKTVQWLIEVFGSAVEVLKVGPEDIQKELQKVGEIAPPGLIHKLFHYAPDRELKRIQQYGCSIITFYDKTYPPLLKEIDTPPLVLYVKGEMKEEDTRSISIVGPRNAKDYGRQVSFQLSSQLADRGLTVVSGLARGIDACAHRGALDVGGRTIAVLGNGLSRVYPAEHHELAAQITKSGALISEFPMEMGPEGQNFPRRNRIISGLTPGTIVVEAPAKSGSLITAAHAHKQGRKVFAVPGQILSADSMGCHQLIKNGAMLVDTAEDLLETLSAYMPDTISNKQPTIHEPSDQQFLFNLPSESQSEIPSEVIVENAVVTYFKGFPRFSINLQHEIQMGSYTGRADVVLVDAEGKLTTVVECKRIGYIGSGVEQLHSYLSATDTRFGIFANSEDPDLWAFYEKQERNKFKQITHSEFKKGIASTRS